MLKRIIPASVKLRIRIWQRRLRDQASGYKRVFARKRSGGYFPYEISIRQPIMKTAWFDNKVHNIRQGMREVEQIVIGPGEVFSFWKSVKKPGAKNNYRVGRNVIAGKLSEDYGGGLCQLSSIIYHASLLSGLTIHERHNHSVDIYQEHERFTPLGADATVVYGYKDLRVINVYDFPVKFEFSIENDILTCTLLSAGEIVMRDIHFESRSNGTMIEVNTICGLEMLTTSVYRKPSDV